jgi:hypothetical protein
VHDGPPVVDGCCAGGVDGGLVGDLERKVLQSWPAVSVWRRVVAFHRVDQDFGLLAASAEQGVGGDVAAVSEHAEDHVVADCGPVEVGGGQGDVMDARCYGNSGVWWASRNRRLCRWLVKVMICAVAACAVAV